MASRAAPSDDDRPPDGLRPRHEVLDDLRRAASPAAASREMFNNRPAAAIVTSSDDAPNDTNGRVTPVIGTKPTTQPMFTNACTMNHDVMPPARS